MVARLWLLYVSFPMKPSKLADTKTAERVVGRPVMAADTTFGMVDLAFEFDDKAQRDEAASRARAAGYETVPCR